MTPDEQDRLAQIRANVEKWRALIGDEVNFWEATFLIGLLDRKEAKTKGESR